MTEALIDKLRLEDESTIDELHALAAILGEGSLRPYSPSRPPSVIDLTDEESRYVAVSTVLLHPHGDVPLELLITLPTRYPHVAPTIQLLNVYLGDVATDHLLFGDILRIFLHEGAWEEGEAVLFDGIERAKEIASDWYIAHLVEKAVSEPSRSPSPPEVSAPALPATLPDVELAMSEPIVDRKSVFVGWAAHLSSPAEVAAILTVIKSDKKVAKATHNVIAWRCRTVDGIVHQDNDDDGESAAGSRLAHLLEILKVDNVLVVVSRWYGGIHLGADRFKHINAAGRAALEAGGFIHDEKATTKSRKH